MFKHDQHPVRKHCVLIRRLQPLSQGEWGGMERLMLDWLERVDYQHCQMTVLVTTGWKEKFDREVTARSLPVTVVEIPFPYETHPLKRFPYILRLLTKLKADTAVFFQAWFWEFNVLDILAAFLVTKNRVFMHENLGAPVPPPKASRRYLGFISGLGLWWHGRVFITSVRAYFCRQVFTVSRDLKDRMIQDWKYSEERTQVAYHGVNVEQFSPSPTIKERMRRSLGFAPESILIIATARLSEQKCLHRAIEAMHRLRGEYPQLHLLIAGQGSLESDLKKLAARGLAQERIRFLGQVASVPDYLKMSDIYILSSDNEGLSLALLEAMATGLICVSTTCTGSPEAIQDGVTGFLVEKSTQGVELGLRKALGLSTQEKDRLSKAAIKFIHENFEINKNIKKIFDSVEIPCKVR